MSDDWAYFPTRRTRIDSHHAACDVREGRPFQRDVVDIAYLGSETPIFDRVADKDIYQEHPIHKPFLKGYALIPARLVVCD